MMVLYISVASKARSKPALLRVASVVLNSFGRCRFKKTLPLEELTRADKAAEITDELVTHRLRPVRAALEPQSIDSVL